MNLSLMKYICYSIFFIVLFSCSSQGKLNFQDFSWGNKPNKIIWLQVAGLNTEHLSLLKFYENNIEDKRAFENFHCLGKMWNYGISKLRLSANEGFLSQMTGAMDFQNQCDAFSRTPLWKKTDRTRFKVGFFDDQKDTKSLNRCEQEKETFFKDTIRWSMREKTNSTDSYFHPEGNDPFTSGHHYFDRSCVGKKCQNTFNENILSTFKRFSSGQSFYFYIAQIYELERIIQEKRGDKIYSFLQKLDTLISDLMREVDSAESAILIVSSSASEGIELPRQGEKWKDFLSSNQDIFYKRKQTQSVIFARGSGAENFCGLFPQSEMPQRIFPF